VRFSRCRVAQEAARERIGFGERIGFESEENRAWASSGYVSDVGWEGEKRDGTEAVPPGAEESQL